MDGAEGGISNEQALRNFLMDIECLDTLREWTHRRNIFDVLRVTRAEIRHSNMLAWLMNPAESHGLGERFLRGVLQLSIEGSDKVTLDEALRLLTMDFGGFAVYREWKNIDIMAVSEAGKVLLCVENKVDSGEGKDQLKRYRETVEGDFPGYKRLYVYLTPGGDDCSVPEIWQPVGYGRLMDLLEACSARVNLAADNQMLINHYVEAVRRDIVGDETLVQVCREIYAKHSQALDLIFENRLDEGYFAAEAIKDWCRRRAMTGEIGFDEKLSAKRYIRFTTPALSGILPDHEGPASGWKSHSMYFYEIKNYDKISIILSLSSQGPLTAEQRTACDRLSEILKSPDKKPDWEWKTLYRLGTMKRPDMEADNYQQQMDEKLDKLFAQLRVKERELLEKWNRGDGLRPGEKSTLPAEEKA